MEKLTNGFRMSSVWDAQWRMNQKPKDCICPTSAESTVGRLFTEYPIFTVFDR